MKDKKRILIVDDEPNIRRILQVAFERDGYVAETAESGEQALALVGKARPSCVVTDVTMPGMSGYDLLRELQAAHSEVPVVIMTAFGTIPQAVQAIRDGAHEYVTKPFDLDHLKRIVESALKLGTAPRAPRRSSGRSPPSCRRCRGRTRSAGASASRH